MAGGTGRVLVSKILHGSPAHVCGRIAVGDELVSIDGFEITPANMHLFAKRAAAGVKDSLIVLRINHSVTCDAAHASKMHEVVLQRSEIFETPPHGLDVTAPLRLLVVSPQHCFRFGLLGT